MWKVIYPNNVCFKFPVYSIKKVLDSDRKVSAYFGRRLLKLASVKPVSNIIEELQIGGNFMLKIKEKIEGFLKKYSAAKDSCLLKETLNLLSFPERNYDMVVENLRSFLNKTAKTSEFEEKDISMVKDALTEFENYFEKIKVESEVKELKPEESKIFKKKLEELEKEKGTGKEEKEEEKKKEKEKKEEKETKEKKEDVGKEKMKIKFSPEIMREKIKAHFKMSEDDWEKLSDKEQSEYIKKFSSIDTEEKSVSFHDLNERDLAVLNKMAKEDKVEKDVKKDKVNEDIKEDKVKEDKVDEDIKEDKVKEDKVDEDIKEDKVKEDKVDEDIKEDKKEEKKFELTLDKEEVLPQGSFSIVGDLGEISAGPLGKVHKLMVKGPAGEKDLYEFYVKFMKKGEKLPAEEIRADVTLEDKRTILGKIVDISNFDDDTIHFIYNGYVEVMKGDIEKGFSNVLEGVNKINQQLVQMKVEAKLKEKMILCSFIVDSKINNGELTPDPEEVNKLVVNGKSFMEAREKVLENIRKDEIKKLMSFSDEKIRTLYKTYATLQTRSTQNLILDGMVNEELLNGIDTDEEFLKKLPWS
jgi:chemotaxis protein histidine kinase CheA